MLIVEVKFDIYKLVILFDLTYTLLNGSTRTHSILWYNRLRNKKIG